MLAHPTQRGLLSQRSRNSQVSRQTLYRWEAKGAEALQEALYPSTLTSGGYNLIQNGSGATFAASKQRLTDVSVDPSANLRIDPTLSGQLTQIHALLPGSPAIDRIPLDACLVKGISTDQRGVKRPDGQEQSCDIGAYEYVDEPA